MKPIKNYSNTVSVNKLGIPDLPTPSASDSGKILGVDQDGKYALGDDQGTVLPSPTAEDNGKIVSVDNAAYVLANAPEELPAVTAADNGKVLAVVNGAWAADLRISDLTSIKKMKITISNGGSYCASLPGISFIDPVTGTAASIVKDSDYSITCDKDLQYGGLDLTGYPGIANANLPAVFTTEFINDFNIKTYSVIRMTKGGTFTSDLSKNIKIELSGDGTSFVTVYDATSLDWSTDTYKQFSIYGDPIPTPLPSVTAADNGDVLTVVNGVWDKAAPAGETTMVVTYNESTGLDETFANIRSRIESGKLVVIKWSTNYLYYKGMNSGFLYFESECKQSASYNMVHGLIISGSSASDITEIKNYSNVTFTIKSTGKITSPTYGAMFGRMKDLTYDEFFDYYQNHAKDIIITVNLANDPIYVINPQITFDDQNTAVIIVAQSYNGTAVSDVKIAAKSTGINDALVFSII